MILLTGKDIHLALMMTNHNRSIIRWEHLDAITQCRYEQAALHLTIALALREQETTQPQQQEAAA